MVVAAIGILINGLSAWLLMAGQKGDLNIRGAFLHMVADAAVSLGVVVAGALILLTGWNWLDPAVSIAISIVIVWEHGAYFVRLSITPWMLFLPKSTPNRW